MSLSITEQCIGCFACKLVCPENAIRVTETHMTITAHRCNECEKLSGVSQCASICPVENAIIDVNGRAINPTGTLNPDPLVLETIRKRQEVLA